MTAFAGRLVAQLGPATDRSRPTGVRRDHHQPDYVILVAVVALAAVGILMVYSSSAMRAYLADDDTFDIVGPQLVWAVLGLGAMAPLVVNHAERVP